MKDINYILELLAEDIVSHGMLLQAVGLQGDDVLGWKAVVTTLLSEGVEIGEAMLVSPDYVEFIAWTGNVDDRISRAEDRVKSLKNSDREFAYWLALRTNVDRFEE